MAAAIDNEENRAAQCCDMFVASQQTKRTTASLAVTAADYMTTYPSSYATLYACSPAKKYLPTK